MVFSLITRFASNVCCFLYPAYASYKALSARPESSDESARQVERWLMYWSVVGSWTAVEAVVGWSFTWLPFYNILKMLVFFYLSLPQSEGSSYIYRAHLAPFFNAHERDIDAFLANLRGRASSTLAEALAWAWDKLKSQLNIVLPQAPPSDPAHPQYPTGPIGQPPTAHIPAAGAAQQMYAHLARYAGTYLPAAIAALSAAASSASNVATSSGGRDISAAGTGSGPIEGGHEPSDYTPRPKSDTAASAQGVRSRTVQHAMSDPAIQARGSSSARLSVSGLPRPPSFGHISQPSSSDSLSSASGVGVGAGRAGYGEMSYVDIQKEEARGAPSAAESGADGDRPGMGEKRRSSGWFGLGGGGRSPREKTE